MTHDVDFVVDGTERRKVVARAESLGYATTFESEGFSNHDHASRAYGHIDFLYIYGATADALFDGAESLPVEGVTVPVLQPEHLIAMKVRAMKNTPMRVLIDAPDIAYLLSLPGIDRARVRDYFSQHGLLKVYDELEKDLR